MEETLIASERRLWRAVLEQAFADAELPACPPASANEDESFEPLERKKARRFLRADSPHEQADLDLVCDFADIAADRVIPWARKRYPIACLDGQASPGGLAHPRAGAKTHQKLLCEGPSNEDNLKNPKDYP